MSQENVQIVRSFYDEVNANLALPGDLFDPDCVTDWTDVAPDLGVVRGVEAAQVVASYFEMFDDFHVEVEEVLYAEDDRVVVAIRDGGRIGGSDKEVWNHFFHSWTLRSGKVVRLSSHTDRERAFEAVGLRE